MVLVVVVSGRCDVVAAAQPTVRSFRTSGLNVLVDLTRTSNSKSIIIFDGTKVR